jgi:hypothetical protein
MNLKGLGTTNTRQNLKQLYLITSAGNQLQLGVAVQERSQHWDQVYVCDMLNDIEHNKHSKAYSQSIAHLADSLWEEMAEAKTPLLNRVDKDTIYMPIAWNILGSASCEIIVAMLNGELPWKAKDDVEFGRTMKSFNRFKEGRAGVYVQYQVSAIDKVAPSPNEYFKAIECVRLYVRNTPAADQYALQVDRKVLSGRKSWMRDARKDYPEARRYAGHRYAESEIDQFHFTPYKPLERRVKRILQFCKGLETRLLQVPKDRWTFPLSRPLSEVGYSKDCGLRLRSHANHTNSNHIMCLFDAVLKLEFPTRRYALDQYVVYYIWGPEQAALSESIFTYIAHAWVKDGTGFTHHFPGLNNDSALNLTARQWLDTLAVKRLGPLRKNIEAAQLVQKEMERKIIDIRNENTSLRAQISVLQDMEKKGLKEDVVKLWNLQMENDYRKKYLNPRLLRLHNMMMEIMPRYAEAYNQRIADREAAVARNEEDDEWEDMDHGEGGKGDGDDGELGEEPINDNDNEWEDVD